MAFVYELPYKTSQPARMSAHVILGDWQVNGIYSAVFGHAVHDHRERRRSEHAREHADGKPERLLQRDRRARETPASTSIRRRSVSRQGVTFGNTGRNQFRGAGYWNVDSSLFRGFPIGGPDKRVEFRVEVFNLFNHPKWGNPDRRRDQRHLRSIRRWHRRSGNGSAATRAPASVRSGSASVPVLDGFRASGSGLQVAHTTPAGTSVPAGVFISSASVAPRASRCILD